MAKAKINPEFTYKTRDGQKVTSVTLNRGCHDSDPYVVSAVINGYEEFFTERGHYYKDRISNLDLVKQPVKKPKPVVKEVMENASTPEVVQQDQVVPNQHVHHDMIVAWAKNPSKKVQCRAGDKDSWITVTPDWCEDLQYRFKPEEPKLLTIIGADGKARSYPEPCRVKPEIDSIYHTPSTTKQPSWVTWLDDSADNDWFNLGIIHLTKEAAELHAKAMLGID